MKPIHSGKEGGSGVRIGDGYTPERRRRGMLKSNTSSFSKLDFLLSWIGEDLIKALMSQDHLNHVDMARINAIRTNPPMKISPRKTE